MSKIQITGDLLSELKEVAGIAVAKRLLLLHSDAKETEVADVVMYVTGNDHPRDVLGLVLRAKKELL